MEMRQMEKIITTHSLTNNTSRFLLVANYHVILSDHATASEANDALDNLAPELDGLSATPWAVAEVVSPGGTTSGKLEKTIGLMAYEPTEEPSEENLFGLI
jgi:hypothetical protein